MKTVGKRMQQSLSDRIFYIIATVIAVAALVIVLYPMYFIVIASFSNSNMVNQGLVSLLPKDINFYGYRKILERTDLWVGYKNTIIYTVCGTLLNLAVTLPAAYVLAQSRFRARRVVMPLFVITMYFGGGMVPTYMLVKTLHLTNLSYYDNYGSGKCLQRNNYKDFFREFYTGRTAGSGGTGWLFSFQIFFVHSPSFIQSGYFCNNIVLCGRPLE